VSTWSRRRASHATGRHQHRYRGAWTAGATPRRWSACPTARCPARSRTHRKRRGGKASAGFFARPGRACTTRLPAPALRVFAAPVSSDWGASAYRPRAGIGRPRRALRCAAPSTTLRPGAVAAKSALGDLPQRLIGRILSTEHPRNTDYRQHRFRGLDAGFITKPCSRRSRRNDRRADP